ncbi:MAG: cyclic nucleotide-binding domain-containing protein [Chloroflexota bacterium]|nr:cyclic nucleotide-binding domain-containing protein [Chloroflexota bacterium]
MREKEECHPDGVAFFSLRDGTAVELGDMGDDARLKYIAYLQSPYLFHGLEREVLEEIAREARLRRVRVGAYFFHQGDPAAVLYVLSEGRVKFT